MTVDALAFSCGMVECERCADWVVFIALRTHEPLLTGSNVSPPQPIEAYTRFPAICSPFMTPSDGKLYRPPPIPNTCTPLLFNTFSNRWGFQKHRSLCDKVNILNTIMIYRLTWSIRKLANINRNTCQISINFFYFNAGALKTTPSFSTTTWDQQRKVFALTLSHSSETITRSVHLFLKSHWFHGSPHKITKYSVFLLLWYNELHMVNHIMPRDISLRLWNLHQTFIFF